MKYHTALELAAAHVAVIELGHDVSELPLAAVLAEALARAGRPRRGGDARRSVRELVDAGGRPRLVA